MIGIGVLIVVLGCVNFWAALAICFTNLVDSPPRYVLAGAFAIAVAATCYFVRPWRFKFLAGAASFMLVLVWFLCNKPSNDRDWQPDVARLASIQIDGNRMTIHNVRNFDYRTETDYTPRWEDHVYDLDKVRTGDITLCYWGSKAIAHAIVSFGFDDGRYLAISIETRKTKLQSYSTIQGFFRQYELIYIVADERDVLRLRTNYRHENLYMYRTRLDPDEVRAVLLSYADTINSLRDHPEFYNTLTTNCVTSIVPHAKAGHPSSHMGWELLLSGYADHQAYYNGVLDDSMPLEELEARSHINAAATAVEGDQDPDFSNRIRIGLPVPAMPAAGEPSAK
jgi:Domain of unknown function (DUF4105)